MRISYAGLGKVGDACAAVMRELGLAYEPYAKGAEGDLLVSVHWRTIFRPEDLIRFHWNAVNLHNSYLPWNRGSDACSWAIATGTPHGATLHYIDEGVDTGPIIYQEREEILPDDTRRLALPADGRPRTARL